MTTQEKITELQARVNFMTTQMQNAEGYKTNLIDQFAPSGDTVLQTNSITVATFFLPPVFFDMYITMIRENLQSAAKELRDLSN